VCIYGQGSVTSPPHQFEKSPKKKGTKESWKKMPQKSKGGVGNPRKKQLSPSKSKKTRGKLQKRPPKKGGGGVTKKGIKRKGCRKVTLDRDGPGRV